MSVGLTLNNITSQKAISLGEATRPIAVSAEGVSRARTNADSGSNPAATPPTTP